MPKTKKTPSKRKPNPAFMRPVQPDDKLAAVVGSKPIPRSELTKKLWDYIKKNGLQDKKVRTQINADDALRPVFNGKSQVSMFEMTKLVSGHITYIADFDFSPALLAPGYLCTIADAPASLLAQLSRLPEIAGVKFFRLSAAAVAIVFASTAAPNARAESNWLTDYKMAQQEAKANNKLLLLDFTGSDWCGWCIKLNKEVFSKPEFKDYANKNLVLMEVDFPRGKSQGSDIKKQNDGLAQQYQIEGFPTIVVLDGDGKKVGLLGYMPGGPTTFIAELEKLRKG